VAVRLHAELARLPWLALVNSNAQKKICRGPYDPLKPLADLSSWSVADFAVEKSQPGGQNVQL
jgi:hypothetical protein